MEGALKAGAPPGEARSGRKDDGALGSRPRRPFLCLRFPLGLRGEADSPPGPWKRVVVRARGLHARGRSSRRRASPPLVSGRRAPGRADPAATRGPRGRRPRPRGGRPGARGPDRHTMEATGGPARPRRREPPARGGGGAGRFQNPPARWGRGGRSGLPFSSSDRGGGLTPSSEPPLGRPDHPPEAGSPRPGRPGRRRRGRVSPALTRGRHFLSFLLVLSTSVSLALAP